MEGGAIASPSFLYLPQHYNIFRMRKIFEPLNIVSRQTVIILVIVEVVIAIAAWHLGSTGGVIPSPGKVFNSLVTIVGSEAFYENFVASLSLIAQGMGYSIIIALAVSYLSLIPFFNPVARFIIKCRYLTLTGLYFLFTLLTEDGGQLKTSLLIFGIVPFFVTSLLSIIDGINAQEYELCKTLRMNNWQTMYEVVIVGRLDQVIEVMRQNFAIAWLMITTVEGLSMSEGGLGTMLIKYNKFLDLSSVFALLAVIFMVGILFDFLLGQMRFWLFPYSKLQLRK
jgi:ABC-type nitrate/sulfonate/bicarbonate transport system permease component